MSFSRPDGQAASGSSPSDRTQWEGGAPSRHLLDAEATLGVPGALAPLPAGDDATLWTGVGPAAPSPVDQNLTAWTWDEAAAEQPRCATCGRGVPPALGVCPRCLIGAGLTKAGVPERVGPYSVERQLGEGGMGLVLEVRHPDIPRPLALKLVRSFGASEVAVERFKREAQLMARVTHPNVARIHALGETEWGPYLVAEKVEGKPLSEWMRGTPLEPRRAAEVVRELADALTAVHAQGIVHRDLKPSNVILRPDGSPALLDFGIARDLDANTLTQTGQLIGTPAWASPEQMNGEPVDERTDVYGLGAVLYGLLARRPPHGAPSMQELIGAVLNAPVDWSGVDAPASLAAICRQAMAKEPGERYGSTAWLRDDLDRFLRGEASSAEGRRSGAGRLAFTAAAVAGLSLVGALALGFGSAGPEDGGGEPPVGALRRERDRPKRPRVPARRPILVPTQGERAQRFQAEAREFLAEHPEHPEAAAIERDYLLAGFGSPRSLGTVPGAGAGDDGDVYLTYRSESELVVLDARSREGAARLWVYDVATGVSQEALLPGANLGDGVFALAGQVWVWRPEEVLTYGAEGQVSKVLSGSNITLASAGHGLCATTHSGPAGRMSVELRGTPPRTDVGLERPDWRGGKHFKAVSFSRDGSRLLAVAGRGSFEDTGGDASWTAVWDTASGGLIQTRHFAEEHLLCCDAIDGRTFLLGSSLGGLYVYAPDEDRLGSLEGEDEGQGMQRTDRAHMGEVSAVCIGPRGERAYSVTFTGRRELKAWSLSGRSQLAVRAAPQGTSIRRAALSPSGRQLATARRQSDGIVIEVLEVAPR